LILFHKDFKFFVLKGQKTSSLTISSLFFSAFSNLKFLKVQLNAVTSSSSASKEIILKMNQSPLNGTCEVNKLNGIAFETNFTVKCFNWVDSDGLVYLYSFYG